MPKKTDETTEARFPQDPAAWETRHTLLVVLAIERWWKRVPPARRNAARALIADVIGQRDIDEATR